MLESIRNNRFAREATKFTLTASLLASCAGGATQESPKPSPLGGQSLASASPDRSPSLSPVASPKIGATGEGNSVGSTASPTKAPEVTCAPGNVLGVKGCATAETPAPVVRGATPSVTTSEGACPSVETSLTTTSEHGGIRFTGFAENGVSNVLNANSAKDGSGKAFNNAIQNGTEGFFADPGGLLVGPDFESQATGKNPWGANPAGWGAMYDSGGHIVPLLAEYHEIARYCGPVFQNIPEGGFIWITGQEFTLEVGHQDNNGKWVSEGAKIRVTERPGTNNFLVIRGLFGDEQQDTDRNKTARITDYVPGHLQLEMYPSGIDANTAFISEDQLAQKAATSHREGSNCGDGGCSTLTVTMVDLNTGAVSIAEQKATRAQASNWKNMFQGWRSVFRNW